MTDQEVLALSDEKIEKMAKLALAGEGIQIVSEPKEPEYHIIPGPDKTIYDVDGCEMSFEDEDTAQSIRDLLQNSFSKLRNTEYDYKIGSDYKYEEQWHINKYSKTDMILQVKKNLVYSGPLYAQILPMLQQNANAKEEYEKLRKEYDTANQDSRDIVATVYDKVGEIRSKYAEFDRMFARYKEYIDLADGQEEIAWGFLKKAYTVSEEMETYIRNKFISQKSV